MEFHMHAPKSVNICRRQEGTFVELDDGTRVAILGPEGWTSLHPDWVVGDDLANLEIGYIERDVSEDRFRLN
jgi:hypothetical protein